MNNIYIGIDFSLKSPAICIYRDGTYKWLSNCSKVEKPKKETKIQEEVASLSDVNLIYQSELIEGTDYSSSDFADMQNYRNHADTILSLIIEEFKDINYDDYQFIIGFEGYSFNSFTRSDNIINIVAATSIMKDRLMSHQAWKERYSINVIAPINIKQLAGYAKFDKVDMFDVFTGNYNDIKEKWSVAIENDHDKRVAKGKKSVFTWNWADADLKGPFYEYCQQHHIERNVKKPKVPKPIDDMIDAYFVCCYLRDIIYNKG